MSLNDLQFKFARAYAHLLMKAMELGFDFSPDYSKEHMENSLHYIRLAQDLLLFKDGKYLVQTEDYRELGEWWENYGEAEGIPLCWGGRFNDGNHFSLEYGGRK